MPALQPQRPLRRADTDALEADHPNGRLVLTMVMLQGLASPGIRFNAYLPGDAATASALGI